MNCFRVIFFDLAGVFMIYGIIEGFAENLEGIERIGESARVNCVKFSGQENRLYNVVGDGLVMQNFIDGVEGKYFYIDMKDVKNEATAEMKNAVSNYILFAVITSRGKHTYEESKIEDARTILGSFLKTTTHLKLLNIILISAFVGLIYFSNLLALVILPVLFMFNASKITGLLFNVFTGKRKMKKETKTIKEQYDRMNPAKLKDFLSENGFLFN